MLINDITKSGEDVHLVSDDRELRIRAIQSASQNSGKLAVCESRSLIKKQQARKRPLA